jgi:peptidase E
MSGEEASDGGSAQRRPRRIFAMGGGGFTMEPENPRLDAYIAGLAEVDKPRVCLLPTAGGDDDDQLVAFHGAFAHLPVELSQIQLFRLTEKPVDVRERLLSQHILYVTGGSMRNLLAIWRAHDLDTVLRDAYASGIVLAGLSAGSMCWFDYGITKSTGEPTATDGLGLLAGSNCVHYDGDPDRRPAFHDALREGLPGGYGVDDGCGLLFEEGKLVEAVASRPEARAYRVDLVDDEVVEEPLDVRMLDANPGAIAEHPPDVHELRSHRAALRERHMRSDRPGRWRR